MDMSFFHRNRAQARCPKLAVLLAGAAARQAMTPTARAMIRPDREADDASVAPEIAPFLGLRGRAVDAAERSPSFNAVIAGALLTSGKGS